ncbi:hypothetical protein BC349_17390 [Flavihumibacter stibioxidans]|uniref:Uncharacterized protein n=1 Tax=Flavihumibacter stibioxidans TaxID=1834163 RepID=A0ABR7ME83_9BACT|nr:hypothetical protein [Flavihumibacter stibioxidans]
MYTQSFVNIPVLWWKNRGLVSWIQGRISGKFTARGRWLPEGVDNPGFIRSLFTSAGQNCFTAFM